MNRSRKYEVNATYNNVYEVKAAFVGYIGDIVALSVGGYVEAADGTNVVIGVLKESVDNTKGGNGDKEVLVDVNPKVWLPRAGASISDLFKRVYATGTNAVALGYNPTTKKADGIVIDYRTDEVLIDFLKGDTAPEAGSGDFLADGSVPMTGDFKLGGNDIWLNAAGTSKIANDGSDNFKWSLGANKYLSLIKNENFYNQIFPDHIYFWDDELIGWGCTVGAISGVGWGIESESGSLFLKGGYLSSYVKFDEEGEGTSLTPRNEKGSLIGVINEINAAVGTQSANIADPSGGATIDAEARTAINSILDVLETFKAMATA